MKTDKQKDIIKYQRPRESNILNIGIVIFGIVFIYLVITMISFFAKPNYSTYEVREGSIVKDTDYTGLVLRTEEIVTAEKSGYVNYYVQNNSKIKDGAHVYSISQKELDFGETSSNEDSLLSSEEQHGIYMNIQEFSNNYSESSFEETYQTKGTIQDTLQDLSNQTKIQIIQDNLDAGNLQNTKLCSSKDDGIIVYSIDGMEDLTAENVSSEHLTPEKYKKIEFSNNMKIEKGNPVYKLITNEKWEMYFEISPETAFSLGNKSSVQVRFKKDNQKMWAKPTFKDIDGKHYVLLSFSNGMIRYINDRYLDIELILEDESGLKIPKSSKIAKEFYVVPYSYLTLGGNNNEYGVLCSKKTDEGFASAEFIEVNLYNKKENVAYLNPSAFSEGDMIRKTESNETIILEEKRILNGVYQINKGYAQFKRIHVLCSSDEYYIIENKKEYGLSNYDHIILDSSTIIENQFVF